MVLYSTFFAKDISIEMKTIIIIMDYPTNLLLNNVNDRPSEESSHNIISRDDNNNGESTIKLLGLVKIILKNLFLLKNQQG